MPNPYDRAYELASIIENDENYQKVKQLTEKVMANPEHMILIESFRQKQFELQQKQMQGKKLEETDLEETNKLYALLSANPEIKKLLDAEERLSMLFAEINRILTGPLEKIYKKDEQE